MAELQVIFASNPTKGLSSKKDNGKLKKKENSRMKKKKPSPAQLRQRKKFAAMARARAKAARAKKRGKNPVKYVATKGRKKVSTGGFLTKREFAAMSRRMLNAKKIARKPGIAPKSKRKISKLASKIKSGLKANARHRRAAIRKAAALKKKGYKIKKVYVAPKSLMQEVRAISRKKRKGKKRSPKKGAAKRYGKESIVAKRRKKRSGKRKSVKRKVAKRRAPRRRSARKGKRRTIWLTKKRKSITIKRKNPIRMADLQQYTGFDATELGSLAVGGAIYGAVNGAAAKYAPTIYAYAARVPVLGTTVVPAMIGIGLKMAGKKTKVKALEIVGEGLLAAAVVGMGINAAQYVPGLSQSTAVSGFRGVDFTPALGGYASGGADFGRDPGNPDFGSVDYTPAVANAGFAGSPQLGQAQLGRDPGNPDFGEIPSGLDGIGEIPQGLA